VFVQVLKGKAADREGLLRQGRRWAEEVKPGAIGFLGSTVGVADDGTFVVIARFEDAAAAAANSARPEQGAWWADTERCLAGEPQFSDSEDVGLLFDGGSDDAGFVQVMESTVTDRAKAEAMDSPELLDQLRKARPDLLGGLRVWLDGGRCVEVAYFTSEEDARAGEASADFAGPADDFASVFQDVTYTDLREPIFA
jgi:hypothetical protein